MKKYSHIFIIVALVVLALIFIKTFDISFPVSVKSTTYSSELSVVGEGKVDAVPDTAYVDLGVTVDAQATAEVAQKAISDKNNAIVAKMKELGIPADNIKTSNFSVYPTYNYEKGSNRIIGYTGNVTISIKVQDVNKVGSLIQEGTKVGANQILGTRFEVSSPEKYREEARDKAIANAREQAEKLARTLGITLGKVVNVVESSPQDQVYPPLMAEKAAGLGGGGGTPNITPGTQTITSVVTLFFEKK